LHAFLLNFEKYNNGASIFFLNKYFINVSRNLSVGIDKKSELYIRNFALLITIKPIAERLGPIDNILGGIQNHYISPMIK